MSGKRAKPWAAQKNGVWIGAYPTREEAARAPERLADREITDAYNILVAQGITVTSRPKAARKNRLKMFGKAEKRPKNFPFLGRNLVETTGLEPVTSCV